ncbi:hypothetical protein [Peribacillus butanolivorans]
MEKTITKKKKHMTISVTVINKQSNGVIIKTAKILKKKLKNSCP